MTSTQAIEKPTQALTPPERQPLRGATLHLARGVWIVLATLSLGIFALSIPYHIIYLSSNLPMSMHIALAEQVSTNRPDGIRDTYQQLILSLGSAHEAEHRMMDCLSEAIWQAQRNNTMPDETAYLACLKNLVEND